MWMEGPHTFFSFKQDMDIYPEIILLKGQQQRETQRF